MPGHIFGGEDLARRLRDLQLHREAGRPKGQTAFGTWDVGEVCKVADLIREIFGRSGVVEVDQHDPGLLKGGYFTGEPGPPGCRPALYPFQGRNLADFEAAIATWRSHR